MSRVLILGAGFSREISEHFPLTNELGHQAIDYLSSEGLELPRRRLPGGDFEAWLSRLAEPQPDLSEEQNLSNRSLFLRIAKAIHAVLANCEHNVLSGQPPWWLQRLLGIAHSQRMILITFNYDTLVEHTVMTSFLYDWKNRSRARPGDIVHHIPPLPSRPGLWLAPKEATSFRLIKLHGSVDTYWVPDDASGATLSRWDLSGTWGKPQEIDDSRRRRELPGRVPFIVPPAAAKSAFYNNTVVRELWQAAAAALRETQSVGFLGYSLPTTDLVVSGMLSDHLTNHSVTIDVVNRHPGPVKERLLQLGIKESAINAPELVPPIPSFVDMLESAAARAAVANIIDSDESLPMIVAVRDPGGSSGAAVLDVQSDLNNPNGLELLIERPGIGGSATRRRNEDEPAPATFAKLKNTILAGKNELNVTFDTGQHAAIIDFKELDTDMPAGG